MRYMNASLEAVFASRNRMPAFKLYAWDPDTVTISQIACAPSCTHGSIPAPQDITEFTAEISWSDRQLSFSLTDPNSIFHPDTGSLRHYFRDAAIIRLVEGDEAVSEAEWIVTFTGQIHGQIGWKTNRSGPTRSARVSVFGRGETQAFKRRKITSKEYSVGTDLGVALSDICLQFMGLTAQEMRIPFNIGRQFQHKTNQISQISPWEAISGLLEVICYIPFFDGEGKLAYTNQSLTRPPDKVLATGVTVNELEVPENSSDAINKVKVTFLDSTLEQVDGPHQKLGDAEVTTGFFSMHECLPCWWSEDHKQRAYKTSMKVIKSVNSGILPVGHERYEEIDIFHGEVHVDISCWVPILAAVMLVEYLALALYPDKTVPIGSSTLVTWPVQVACPAGFGATIGPVTSVQTTPAPTHGYTIPWGRVLQAQAMGAIMLIMMCMGSAQYEIWGTPYDMAYLEKQSIAVLDGLDYWQENEKEIKNDFIGSHEQADIVAITNLIWEQVKAHSRRVTMEDDPSLEVGDIIVLPDGRKIVITALSKRIKRGEVVALTVEGGKVLTT